MAEKADSNKMNSRKFIVWLVWLLITLVLFAFCTIVMLVTKQILESMTSLIEKTLTYFFSISMMYLGCNASQKVGVAFADAIVNKNTEETTEEQK